MKTRSERQERQEEKKKRRKLLVFLRRLKKILKKLGEMKEWYDDLSELNNEIQSLLGTENDQESQDLKEVRKAIEMTNAGMKGFGATAQALDLLEPAMIKAIKALPAGGVSLGTVVIGLVLVAAVAAGVGVARVNATAVEINVTNEGCSPIAISQGIMPGLDEILGVLGAELPSEPILPGRTAGMKLPAVKATIDATGEDIQLEILGVKTSFDYPRRVTQVEIDGALLLGRRTTVDLGNGKTHRVVVRCR